MNRRHVGLAMLAAFALAGPAAGQTSYTWNGVATSWDDPSGWSPTGGPPTAVDTARFLPTTPAGFAFSPTLGNTQSALSVTFAPNPALGGWAVTGNGNLIIGGTGSTGLTTFGPATYTLNGPTLTGSTSGTPLNLTVGNGSTLLFAGDSRITANQGTVVVSGGTLRLDNTAVNQNRFQIGGLVTVSGGGLFELIGNPSTGTIQNVGALNVGSNVIGGVNTFRVSGANTTLNFANSGTFGSRPGTRGVYRYETPTGNLGDAGGSRVTFTGTPFLGANGLLSNSAGGGTVGFAIASDAGGTDYATWTAGTGVIRNTPSVVASTASAIQAATATDRVQFNPAADQTATGVVTNGSLRVTPAAAGLTLTLGANNLATNAVMLDGANSYTITSNATALLGGTGTRYLYVNSPTATLTVNGLQVANGGNPTTFAGPGLVDLTGTATQNTLTTTNRFIIAGGVVRGNNTQIGFGAAGAGIISLTGGVLEIKDGANGTGTAADFTRATGAAAGNVTWGGGTTNEVGSGGFSAFGSAASVNLGGVATPTAVQWNTANFVPDGYALKFGSTRSNAPITFLNPIALDAGTAGAYQLREVNVTAGVGGDRAVLTGVLSGSASSDFVKTGTGTLELTGMNTYAGNTLISGGRLVATNTISATGTGNVVVGSGGVLTGTGTLTPNAGSGRVSVLSGGLLAPGTPNTTGPDTPGALTVASGLTLNTGSTLRIQLNSAAAGSGYSQVVAIASAPITLAGDLQLFTGAGFAPAANDRFVILSNTGTLTGNFNGLAQNATGTTTDGLFSYQISYTGTVNGSSLTGGSSVVLFNVAPVPEPSLMLAAAVGGLGLLRLVRRRAKA